MRNAFLTAAGCVGLLVATQAAAQTDHDTFYEVRIGGTTTDYATPGSYSGAHGSVSTTAAPMPTLNTTINVGDFQDDTGVFMRYYYRVNGPQNEVVPVSLSGFIRLTAQAPDTGQANSTGQIDLPTSFTSDFKSLEIDRGGSFNGAVTQTDVLLHGLVYTNGWNAVILRATSGARGSRDGGASGSAMVDPTISIDQSFFTGMTADQQARYSLSFSDGVGNGPAVAGGVPEPATWGMLLVGFGAMGVGMRRRGNARRTVAVA